MNFLSDLANRAKKKLNLSGQAPTPVNTTSPQMQQSIQNAKYGVLAHNPAAQQQFIRNQAVQPSHVNIAAEALHSAPKALEGFGLGLGRSVIGTGQAVSGLVDLATPGLGTNRISKALDTGARGIDRFAGQQGVNPAYKVGQLTGDTAQFFTPGEYLKGASAANKTAEAAKLLKAGKMAQAAKLTDEAKALANTPLGKLMGRVDKYDSKINGMKFSNDIVGRSAGTIARSTANAGGLANIVSGTALDVGANASKGGDTSPLSVGQSLATNAVFNAAPALAVQGGREIRGGVKATGQAQKAAAGKLQVNRNVDSQVKQLTRERDGWVKQRDNLPIDNYKAAEVLQRKIDRHDGQIAQLQAGKQKLTLKDKALTANPGLTVGGPNALQYMYAKKHGRVFDGVDGKPRFEIDDSGARIANPNGSTLGEVLDHPELYKNYPQLKDTPVVKGDIPGAAFDESTGKIILGHGVTSKDIGNLLHENQHNVQGIEDFARGGSPFTDLEQLNNHPEMRRINQERQTLDERLKTATPEERKALYEADDALTRQKNDLVSNHQFNNYRKLAGEAEARAVEKRVNLKDSERYVKQEPSYRDLARESIHKQPNLTNKQLDSLSPEAIDGLKQQGFKGVSNGKRTVRFDEGATEAKLTKIYHGTDKVFDDFDVSKSADGDESTYKLFDPAKTMKEATKSQPSSQPATSLRSTFYDSLDVPKDELIIRGGDGPAMSVDKRAHMDDLSPEQNKFVAEYAEHLKEVGQGNGVDIHPDGRRITNNFRSDELKGKQMTNSDWFDEARRQLETGKADGMAQDEWNASTAPKAKPAPVSPKPAAKQQLPASRETGGVSLPKTTSSKPIDTKAYVKERTKAQEVARDKGSPSGLKAKYEAAKGDIKAKLVDSFAPIEDTLNKAEKAGAKVDPSSNIKYQIDRVLRAKTIAGQYAKDNGLHKIIQNVKNTDEFDQYLIARHTADVTTKTGRNAEADAALVKQLSGKYEAKAKEVDAYSQKLLDQSVSYGLVSKDLAAQLKKQYPKYVPINRVFSELEQQGIKPNGKSPASLSQQSVVQRLKGSDREIESPLNSILEKTEHVVEQGERNKAAQILTSYKDLPDNPFGLKELKPTETVGSRPVISYLENGKQRRFETTPEIATAAKALDKQQLGFVGQIFAVPTRILRLGATGVNVGFTLANVAKDVASGFVNSKHGATMADPGVFLKALKAATDHNSKEYGELVREGAGGTSFDVARNAPKQNLKAIRAGKNMATRAAYTATHPAALLRAIEDTIGRGEELGRAVQYYGNKKAFAKTNSAADAKILAADAARNNTVNFSRAGDYGRAANTLLPYLNAGVQGARTFTRTMKDRPVQTATKVAVTAFLPMAALTAWNLSDPKRKEAYDSLADNEKQNNFILVPPNPKLDPKTNRWNVIKVPMSQEIAGLAGTVRNGVEKLKGDKGFQFGTMLNGLVGTTTSINATSSRELLGQVTPQALKPGLETVMNQNLFSGNEVVPKKLKNLDNKDQYNQYTSGTAKTIGKVTGGSPLAIDNAIRTSTGGTGQNLVNLSDRLLAKTGVIGKDDVKGKSLTKAVSDRFAGAQAKSDSVYAKDAVKDKLKALKQTQEFKSMSQDEQAKALNRLETATNNAVYQSQDAKNQTGQYAPDYKGKVDKLSDREAGLLDGKTDVKSFLTAKTSGSSTTELPKGMNGYDVATLKRFDGLDADAKDKIIRSENDAEYKLKLAEYERDKKLGKLSRAETIRKDNELVKAKVGKDYSKDLRETYELGKDDVFDLITTDKHGQKLADDLLKYGDALAKATGDKNKFRTSKGAVSFATKKQLGASGSGMSAVQRRLLTQSTSNVSDRIALSNKIKATTIKAPKQHLSSKLSSSKMKSYKGPTLYKKKVA